MFQIKHSHRLFSKITLNSSHHFSSLLHSLSLIQSAAKTTLGPFGRTAIIDYQAGIPRVTKDGVTVIKNISTGQNRLNVGLQLIQRVANNINEHCGDGTTTSSLIACEAIIQAIKYIQSGYDPI